LSTYCGNGHSGPAAVITHIDTPVEVDYYCHGGILPYVLRSLARD
jgi:aconitate hydratase